MANFKQSEIEYCGPGDKITFTDEQKKIMEEHDKFFDDMQRMKDEIEDVLSKYGFEIKNMMIDGGPNNRGYISIWRKEKKEEK